MSRVFLPIGKKAHAPYRIMPLGIEVFTLEELCYYIVKEADLLESEFMSAELIFFIEEELSLPKLAEKLRQCMEQTGSLKQFCETLLSEADFLSREEFPAVAEKLTLSENSTDLEKMVKKLDALLRHRDYHTLIRQTDALLGEVSGQEDSKEKTETEALLYEKQALGYVYLFYYKSAAELFLKEKDCYEKLARSVYVHKALQQYLLCQRLALGEDAFHSFIEAHPEYLELSLMAEQKLARAEAQTNADIRRGIRMSDRDFERLIREFERM